MVTLTPPVTPTANQGVVWSTAQTSVFGPVDGQGSAVGSNTTGEFVFLHSRPLGNWYYSGLWSNFVVPKFPVGWAIDAIYAVAVASGNTTVALSQLITGPNLNMYVPEPATLTVSTMPGGGVYSGQYVSSGDGVHALSLGNTEDVFSTVDLGARLFSTEFVDIHDTLSIDWIGLAVYFSPIPEPNISVSVGNNRQLSS